MRRDDELLNSSSESEPSRCVPPIQDSLLLDVKRIKSGFGIHFIQRDDKGEYTFVNSMIGKSSHQLFFDGQTKIAELYIHKKSQLIFKSFTSQQINLLINVNADEYIISTQGSVYIAGQLTVENAFVVLAKTLFLATEINLNGDVALEVEDQVILSHPLNIKNFSVTARLLMQNANVKTSGQYDVCVESFKQHTDIMTSVSSLRLIAHECEISGILMVVGCCFLAVNKLILGDSHSQTSIKLMGENYLHTVDSYLQGNTQLFISKKDPDKKCEWRIDNQLILDHSALFDAKQCNIDVALIESNGKLCIDECKFSCKKTVSVGGEFSLTKSEYVGEFLSFFAGRNRIKIDKSSVLAQKQLLITSDAEISDSTIESEAVCFKGALNIKKLNVKGYQSLTFTTGEATIEECVAHTRLLFLNGGDENKVRFSQCDFTMMLFTQSHHMAFNHSSIFGLDVADTSHLIKGILTLTNSRFVTESQVTNLEKGKINLDQRSVLQTGRLYSMGSVTSDRSFVISDSLLQRKADLSASKSMVKVKKKIFSSSSKTTVTDYTQLMSEGADFGRSDQVQVTTGSSVAMEDSLFTGESSTCVMHDAKVQVKKFGISGAVEYSRSSLSAEDLRIYDKFSVDKSTINIKNAIKIAKEGQVQLTQSVATAEQIESSGDVKIQEGILEAKQDLSLWSTSETTLGAGSALVADLALLRGAIKAIKPTSDSSLSAPLIKIQKQLDISSTAKVSGDSELIVDADVIKQAGEIDLSAGVRLKGRELHNTGSITATDIYLGFDDFVFNYGSLSGDSITAHSNFMNLLGSVYAKKYFSSVGLTSLNLGLISANNYSSDSLFSLNAGLIVPNFSADFQTIFSWSNLWATFKSCATTFFPQHTSLFNIGETVYRVESTTSDLLDLFQKYDFKTLMSLRRHELIPLYCQVKNAATLGYGLYHTGVSSIPDPSPLSQRLASIFTGHYSDCSLSHANLGSSFSFNTEKKSLLHFNSGHERSLLSHHLDTHHFINTGVSGGAQTSVSATTLLNTGKIFGDEHLTLRAGIMQNQSEGKVTAPNTDFSVDYLEQLGSIDLAQGSAKIQHFTSGPDSATSFSSMHVVGEDFKAQGRVSATSTEFTYAHQFETADGSLIKTDDVRIHAPHISQGGTVDYSHLLHLEAETVTQQPGAVLRGETSSDPMEIDELNPQHVLSIFSETTTVHGKISGGDFTQLQGAKDEMSKAKSLQVGESGEIDLTHGQITVEKTDVAGRVALQQFTLESETTDLHDAGKLSLTGASFKGKKFKVKSMLSLERTKMDVDKITLTKEATAQIKDSTLQARQVEDSSTFHYEGLVSITTDDYKHHGHIAKPTSADKSEEHLFHVETKTATLAGSGDIGKGYFDIKHFADREKFVAGDGEYKKYHLKGLTFTTDDKLHFDKKIKRRCDLSLQSPKITMKAKYNHKRRYLEFITTEGDVKLAKDVTAKGLDVKSTRDIYNNKSIKTAEGIHFDARRRYLNLGGTLNGDLVAIRAKSIKIISTRTKEAEKKRPIHMGKRGIINGRSRVLLEATKGNIKNAGGMIRSGDYTQLTAKGNIKNLHRTKVRKGKHDKIKKFEAGLISGGDGKKTKGLGLFVKAQEKVVSDASSFISNGDNFLDGKRGVKFKARYYTYVAHDKKKRKWYGKRTHTMKTKTNLLGNLIHSAKGRNIIRSKFGLIKSIASRFSALLGTDVYARRDVKLFGLKTRERTYKSRSSLWGLTRKKREEMHERSTPTIFVDHGKTRIHSKKGNVEARGALFIGKGDLHIKAKKRIKIGADILKHEIKQKMRRIGFSMFGSRALKSLKKRGSLWDAATAEDATLAKLSALSHSKNPEEILSSASNLGIDLYNTSKSVTRGLAGKTLDRELLSRYGLGGAEGFSPAVTISLTTEKTHVKYQTQGLGGIDRDGDLKLEAGKSVKQGVTIHGKNIEIDSPKYEAVSTGLKESVHQVKDTQHVTVTPTGEVKDVGVSRTKSKQKRVRHVLAKLHADENLKMHHKGKGMSKVKFDGTTASAATADLNIDELIIIDKQDTAETSTQSAGVSLAGQVSGAKGKGHSALVSQHSGFDIKEGLNTDGHHVRVDKLELEGGKITTGGKNKLKIRKIRAKKIIDKHQYSGIGGSGSLGDLKRVLAPEKEMPELGEETLPTVGLTLDQEKYRAEQIPVIHGKTGTDMKIKKQRGRLRKHHHDGEKVKRDDAHHIHIDLPVPSLRDRKRKRMELETNDEPEEIPTAKKIKLVQLDKKLSQAEKISEELKQNLKGIIYQAADEFKQAGTLSPTAQGQLKKSVPNVLLQALKGGTEIGWGKLMDGLGPEFQHDLITLLSKPETRTQAGVKAYMGSKGVAITFAFNLATAFNNKDLASEEKVDEAVANTVGDVVFGLAIDYGAGTLATPLGYTLFGLGVADALLYDPDKNEKMFQSSVETMREARDLYKKDEWLRGYGLQQFAAEQQDAAIQSKILHEISEIPSQIGHALCDSRFFSSSLKRKRGDEVVEDEQPAKKPRNE